MRKHEYNHDLIFSKGENYRSTGQRPVKQEKNNINSLKGNYNGPNDYRIFNDPKKYATLSGLIKFLEYIFPGRCPGLIYDSPSGEYVFVFKFAEIILR